MHDEYKFDDQSVRKNEWNIRLIEKGVRVFIGVFREDGPASRSPHTHRHLDSTNPNRLFLYRAWELLRNVDPSLTIKDEQFWLSTIPGLVGVNSELWSREKQERSELLDCIVAQAQQACAHLLFCDLGTGLATENLTHSSGRRSQKHLYWDELRQLFNKAPSSLAVYQHGRRAPWTTIINEYRMAAACSQLTVLQLSAGRARLVLLLKPQHSDFVRGHRCAISSDLPQLRVYDDTGSVAAVDA